MEAPDSFATSVELQVTVVAVIPIVINASSHTCRRIRSNIVLFSLDDGNVTSLGKGLRDTALSKLVELESCVYEVSLVVATVQAPVRRL